MRRDLVSDQKSAKARLLASAVSLAPGAACSCGCGSGNGVGLEEAAEEAGRIGGRLDGVAAGGPCGSGIGRSELRTATGMGVVTRARKTSAAAKPRETAPHCPFKPSPQPALRR